MMCYDSEVGAFDFTYKELETLRNLCIDKISKLSKDIETINDPFKYLELNQLGGKLSGVLNLMNLKRTGSGIKLLEKINLENKYIGKD